MLQIPSSFPHPGSWALYHGTGKTVAVRIQHIKPETPDAPKRALISIPTAFGIASGNPTVDLDELLDPTPLTPEETAELDRLNKHLAGLKAPERSALFERCTSLAARQVHAQTLDALLARIPAKAEPAAAVARRAA